MSTATESFTWTTPCEFSGHFTVNIVPGHVRIYAGQEVEPAYLLVDMTPPLNPAPLSREDVARVLLEHWSGTDRGSSEESRVEEIAKDLGCSAELARAKERGQ